MSHVVANSRLQIRPDRRDSDTEAPALALGYLIVTVTDVTAAIRAESG